MACEALIALAGECRMKQQLFLVNKYFLGARHSGIVRPEDCIHFWCWQCIWAGETRCVLPESLIHQQVFHSLCR